MFIVINKKPFIKFDVLTDVGLAIKLSVAHDIVRDRFKLINK